jgi:hypothetical protein
VRVLQKTTESMQANCNLLVLDKGNGSSEDTMYSSSGTRKCGNASCLSLAIWIAMMEFRDSSMLQVLEKKTITMTCDLYSILKKYPELHNLTAQRKQTLYLLASFLSHLALPEIPGTVLEDLF